MRQRRIPRIFRDRTQPLEFGDKDIERKYRFTREGCITLIDILTPKLSHKTQRSRALPPQLQIFVALNYFATGAVLDDTATTHGVDRNTASCTVHRVAEVLCEMKETVSKIQTFLLSFSDSVLVFKDHLNTHNFFFFSRLVRCRLARSQTHTLATLILTK